MTITWPPPQVGHGQVGQVGLKVGGEETMTDVGTLVGVPEGSAVEIMVLLEGLAERASVGVTVGDLVGRLKVGKTCTGKVGSMVGSTVGSEELLGSGVPGDDGLREGNNESD